MATPTLAPAAGFVWAQVRWDSPFARPSNRCSYCEAVIPEEEVPLRLWKHRGAAAVFCAACMQTWWGMENCDDGEELVADEAP